MLERASDLAPLFPFLKRRELNHVVFYSLLQGYRISLLKHSAIEKSLPSAPMIGDREEISCSTGQCVLLKYQSESLSFKQVQTKLDLLFFCIGLLAEFQLFFKAVKRLDRK